MRDEIRRDSVHDIPHFASLTSFRITEKLGNIVRQTEG